MTTTRRHAGSTSAAPAQGVRIERILGRPAHRTEDGRIALPLWVLKNGRHVGDTDLVMTVDEAAELRAALDKLLGGDRAEDSR